MLAEKLALLPAYRPNGKSADSQTYSQTQVSEIIGTRQQAISQARVATREAEKFGGFIAELVLRL
jgi:hypothetical protein